MRLVVPLRAVLLSLLFGLSTARALVIAGDGGLTNTNAPAGDQGWSYVGTVHGTNSANTTGVYLGNNWVITANHVKGDTPTNFILGGTSYDIQLNTWKRMTNSNGTQADLALVRLSSAPTFSTNLTLRSTSPGAGTAVTMIGNGYGCNTNQVLWYIDTTPTTWVWSTNTFPGWDSMKSGYNKNYTNTKRWGTNTVTDTGFDTGSSSYYLYTTFDRVGEAQGAVLDSGGGVFSQNGGTWELAGIMFSLSPDYSGQPVNTAVFGNETFAVDVSQYRTQIIATIPEPAACSPWDSPCWPPCIGSNNDAPSYTS